MSRPERVRVELFGGVHVLTNGVPAVRPLTIRQQQLIAYLALHGAAPITRQQIAGALWPDSAGESPRHIFILINGTWARWAPWAQMGSPFVEGIHKRWPDAMICHFQWTGLNSTPARVAASHVLSDELKTVASEHPDSRIVLIGHSHGGNVARWAWACSQAPVAAAVYLDTPFVFPTLLLLGVGIAYGPWQGVLSLARKFRISASPVGLTETLTLSIADESGGPLRHSIVHDQPEVVDAVCAWLSNALDDGREQ